MVDLAKLVVRLEAETAKYRAELDKATQKLESFQRSTDKVNQKLSGFEASSQKIFSRLRAGIVGFVASVSFGKIIQETSNAQAALAKLDNAVKNNAGAAGASTKELVEFSSELQRLTTFADESIQEMQALLLTFKQIRGSEFQQAQVAILDLATALGKDLNSSALLVGRALADPIKGMTALARAGVVLSGSQKALIKDLVETGRLAEAQGIILKGLESRFGGAARAARNTLGGAISGLKNAFGDLLEADTGVSSLTSSVNKLSEVLSDPKTKAAVDALFGLIISTVSVAVEQVSALTNALSGIAANADKSPLFNIAKGVAKEFNLVGTELEKLEDDIEFLESARDSFFSGVLVLGNQKFAPDSIFGFLSKDDVTKRLQEMNLQAARLRHEIEKTTGPTRRPTKAGMARADDEIIDSEAYEKAKDALEKLLATTKQQAAALDDSAEATIRFRLTQGDLAKEMRITGAEGENLSKQILAAARALDVSKAVKDLEDLNRTFTEQNAGLEDNAVAAVRYRLELGDLADEVKRAGEAGQKLKETIIASATALDVSKAVKSLEDVERSLTAQAEGLEDNAAAAIRYRLELGDLADEVKRAGEAGKALKLKIIEAADAKQQKSDLHDIAIGLQEINSQIATMQGDSASGALLNFDKQNAELVRKATRQGDEAALARIQQLRDLTKAQAEYNALQVEASRIQSELDRQEQRISNSQQIGAMSDLEAMSELSTAREEAVEQLRQIEEKMNAIAVASGNPELIENTKEFNQEIENLAATTDLVAGKIRDFGEDAFAEFATTAIRDIDSIGEAVGNMLNDIANQLIQMAARQLFQQIFQTGTTGGGWIDALAGFVTGGGGKGTTSGGSKDSGGRGRPGVEYTIGVGAQPEKFIPDQPGKFLPRDQWMPREAAQTVQQNFYIEAPKGTVSRQTQMQIGANASKSLQNANRRNN